MKALVCIGWAKGAAGRTLAHRLRAAVWDPAAVAIARNLAQHPSAAHVVPVVRLHCIQTTGLYERTFDTTACRLP